jgi:hypothetical protein
MPLRPMTDNTRFARVLVRLEVHGANGEGRAMAKDILGTYAGGLAMRGVRAIEPGLAIDELLSEPLLVTIEGPADDPKTQDLRRAALNLHHGWLVIKTAPGGSPSATLSWRRGTRRVTDPAAMAGQLKGLVQAGVGAS